jgi:hypothetical protein
MGTHGVKIAKNESFIMLKSAKSSRFNGLLATVWDKVYDFKSPK